MNENEREKKEDQIKFTGQLNFCLFNQVIELECYIIIQQQIFKRKKGQLQSSSTLAYTLVPIHACAIFHAPYFLFFFVYTVRLLWIGVQVRWT